MMYSEPLHILLLRHGQTDANKNGIVQGHQPTSINALGRRQAERLAQRLVSFHPPIEQMVCSDLLRAKQTAEPILRRLRIPVVYDAAWRERCYGIFEGKTVLQRQTMRQQMNLMDNEPPPGAQGTAEYQEQIWKALLALPQRFPHVRSLAVMTHGGACRAVLMMLHDGRLPLASGSIDRCDEVTANGSVTHLICHRDGPMFEVVCRNDTSHMEELATLTDVG